MINKKIITFLLISIVITEVVQAADQNNLRSSLTSEEAYQELCPFPGYHGNYCPVKHNLAFAGYKRQLQNGVHRMPSGIGASFDITTGELKLPAIQLTYQEQPQQGSIWKDSTSGIQYIIADETKIEQAESQSDVKIFRNEFELSNIWLEATQRGQWLGGEYSSSKDLNNVFDKFFKGEQETAISQLTKNVVRLTFKNDNLKLNRFAQRAVDSLPQEFNQAIYNEFLNAWGTHIAVDTHLGGMIEKQTVYKDCVYATPTFTGGLTAAQLDQALNNELRGKQADGYFAARRRVSIDHKLGGNPEDVANWESTISQNPALLKINRFLSWDHFVSDGKIRVNLQQAIQNRVKSMIERQNSYKAQVQEQRRLQRCGPKTAYSVLGTGKYKNQLETFVINPVFEMKEASQCPPGQPFAVTRVKCSSGDMTKAQGLLTHVRYERDNQGRYRSIMLDFKDFKTDIYGPWVDRGCSINQPPSYPQYTDFKTPPPQGSWFKIICADCVPSVYNTPNGNLLQCSCPAF